MKKKAAKKGVTSPKTGKKKVASKKASPKKASTKKVSSKKKAAPKKTAAKKKPTKKKARARELIDTGTDKRYVRRDEQGQFDEVVDMGKSLAMDRKRTAKTIAKPGQGDKGDLPKKTKGAQ